MLAVTVCVPAVKRTRSAVPVPCASGVVEGAKAGSLEVKFTVPVKAVVALLNLSKAERDTGAATPAVRLAGSPVRTRTDGAPAFAWTLNEAVPVTPATEELNTAVPEIVGN